MRWTWCLAMLLTTEKSTRMFLRTRRQSLQRLSLTGYRMGCGFPLGCSSFWALWGRCSLVSWSNFDNSELYHSKHWGAVNPNGTDCWFVAICGCQWLWFDGSPDIFLAVRKQTNTTGGLADPTPMKIAQMRWGGRIPTYCYKPGMEGQSVWTFQMNTAYIANSTKEMTQQFLYNFINLEDTGENLHRFLVCKPERMFRPLMHDMDWNSTKLTTRSKKAVGREWFLKGKDYSRQALWVFLMFDTFSS